STTHSLSTTLSDRSSPSFKRVRFPSESLPPPVTSTAHCSSTHASTAASGLRSRTWRTSSLRAAEGGGHSRFYKLVPALAKEVGRLFVFHRSANYTLPRDQEIFSPADQSSVDSGSQSPGRLLRRRQDSIEQFVLIRHPTRRRQDEADGTEHRARVVE